MKSFEMIDNKYIKSKNISEKFKRERGFSAQDLKHKLFRKISIVNDNLEMLEGYIEFTDRELRTDLKEIIFLVKDLARLIQEDGSLTQNIVNANRTVHMLGNMVGGLGITERYYDQKPVSDELLRCFKKKSKMTKEYLLRCIDDRDYLKKELETPHRDYDA